MTQESRTRKTFLNARINTICYFVGLITAFFTRKILLDNLGLDFMGLTGTLYSVLGFLNLAELGVGAAIGYVLYKPVYEQNQEKIKEIISVLGYLYRMIGFVILGAGLLLSLSLPWIFKGANISLWIIYLGFYCYLSSTLLTYFSNYRISLLSADQKMYKYTGINQIVGSTKVVVQMVLAYLTQSLWLFLIVELAFSGVNAIIIKRIVHREYPWLTTEVAKGRALLKEYPEIVRYIKQIFVHQVAGFIQYQTLPLFINAYVSLPMVAVYANYTIITERVKGFFNGALGGTEASIGNLVSEGNAEKIWSVFKQIFLGRLFVGSIFTACIYYLINDFILVWLGKAEYAFENDYIVFLICCGFFLSMVRGVFDQFLHSYGLFYDIWAPWTEAILSILGSLVLGYYYGLTGLILSPLISLIIIVFGWKPYFLFSKGLKQPLLYYLYYFFGGIGILFVSYFASAYITDIAKAYLGLSISWSGWIGESIIFFLCNTLLITVVYFTIFRDFRALIYRFIKHKTTT